MNKEINTKIFNKFPVLESERLIFRAFKNSDAHDLFLIRSNDDVMYFMDSPTHKTLQDSEKVISSVEKTYKNQTGVNWAIIENSTNEFIGYFGYWRIIKEHCRAEIGYALKPEFWGRGYMSETLKILIDFGFNDLRIHSIEANVNPKNEKSVQLLEKLNFKKEAYFRENYFFNGKFVDSIIYSLLESDLN
jgi:ribosomal-protein-alanine N-acetyltransferase